MILLQYVLIFDLKFPNIVAKMLRQNPPEANPSTSEFLTTAQTLL
jgi:hypothetical protein